MNEELLKEDLENLIVKIKEKIDLIEIQGWNNKQWALDALDKLNEQSVRF